MAPPAITVILVIVGMFLIIWGYTMSGNCGGGYSLVLFGLGALSIGIAPGLFGAWPVTVGAAILALILILGGISIATSAGCAL